jgi:hypothetical protein
MALKRSGKVGILEHPLAHDFFIENERRIPAGLLHIYYAGN